MDATVLQQTLAAQPVSPDTGDALPAWFTERRRQALVALAQAPWPQRKDEAWKYTSLHELSRLQPQAVRPDLPAQVEDAALAFIAGHGVTGHAPPFMRRLAELVAAHGDQAGATHLAIDGTGPGDVFDLANTAFATDGALIDVPAGHADGTWFRLQVSGVEGGEARHWHLANRIELGEGASLRLHLDEDATSGAGLATLVSRICVRRGAHLELAWTRAAGTMAGIARTRIELEDDARLTLHLLDAGAAPSRHDLTVILGGERAHAELGGVFLLDGRSHADMHLDLRHASPNATSNTTWRAIANGRARAVFDGHITVATGADGTDAQLGCKSLIGTVQAEVDVRPVLEIYADDVKCSHGATVGQLDELALFYLRSRGIGAELARAMLLRAFAAEAFGERPDTPAAQRLAQWLEGA